MPAHKLVTRVHASLSLDPRLLKSFRDKWPEANLSRMVDYILKRAVDGDQSVTEYLGQTAP